MQKYASSYGCAIIILHSNRDKNVTLDCEKGCVYHNHIDAQMERNAEKTSTKRMGCPLHLYAKLTDTTQWELQKITLIIIIWLMKI